MGSPASSRYGLGSDCVSRGPPPRFCGRGPRPRRVGRRRSFMHQCVLWSDLESRLWRPPMWCPLRCCYVSREMHVSGIRHRSGAISTFVWSSVYWRVRTGHHSRRARARHTTRDSTFPAISATRPSLRPGIAHAAASNGKGRIERVAARTLPCVVAARALPSATSIITY
jgi:hypothetical protein